MFECILQENISELSIFGLFFLLFTAMSDWQDGCHFNLIVHQAGVWHSVDSDLHTFNMIFKFTVDVHCGRAGSLFLVKKPVKPQDQNVRDLILLPYHFSNP